ncbi:MAG TPA: hypothetical protein VEK79_05415 [Thermoanaerobaculia bacterium]|nr:hypothetical protein [Thermoanaerobaculia bacterium]
MTESMSRWYIDAWCVFDGIVFASESEDRTNRPHVRTVFVTPPYWRPIALANPATALRATRGPFQDRLFNGAGEEIPFETLDEIIELARRAYVLGAYNTYEPPTNDMVMAVPMPPDRGAPSAALAAVLPMLHTVVDARHQERLANTIVETWGVLGVRKAFQSWCNEYCRWVAVTLAAGTSKQAGKYLREWLQAVFTMFGVEAVGKIMSDPRFANRFLRIAPADARALQQTLLDGLLMRLPAMRRDGSVGTLGDALALAFSSRLKLQSATLEDFLPVLFAGLALEITTAELRAVGEWISEGVPRLVPANHEAAVVLEALVERVARVGRLQVMDEITRWRDEDFALVVAERTERQEVLAREAALREEPEQERRRAEEVRRREANRAAQVQQQKVMVRTRTR